MVKHENEIINSIRHSLAHLLAMAVLKKFPKAKLWVGPVIENGFYYDFDLANAHKYENEFSRISDADLPEIEKEMRNLVLRNLDFTGKNIMPAEAKKLFKNQPYKLDLIKDFIKEKRDLTVYHTGDFTDLCRGGHIHNTSEINPGAFKLTKTSGAYWKGNQENPQLTRIYGVAFETKEELENYLTMQEEATKRDHRVLGKNLELFSIIDEIGPGLPLFYPKGAILRKTVEEYIASVQEKRGYEAIWIPHITKGELYKISGHLDKFDAMDPPMKLKDEADYYLKPMNCPHFMMLYKTRPRSYRDLPIRWTSTTTNYRYEKSGELTGLARVRSLTQDDCHVFLLSDQIEPEVNLMLDMIEEVYEKFGFHDFWVRVSTHDPTQKKNYIGDPAIWKNSEEILSRLIEKRGWKHEIGIGEAAFYGPKLDFIFKDVLGREWQLSTIQLDMNLPERFDLEFIDSNGTKKRPVVLHRAILGSTERFLGILIEHFAGEFPFWLAPIQVAILAINDRVLPYCREIAEELKKHGVRITIDPRNESIGKKIRESELQKIPYLFVIGDKEAEAKNISVREHKKGNLGNMATASFLALIKNTHSTARPLDK